MEDYSIILTLTNAASGGICGLCVAAYVNHKRSGSRFRLSSPESLIGISLGAIVITAISIGLASFAPIVLPLLINVAVITVAGFFKERAFG